MHLAVENLACRRGDRLVFEDVSFAVTAGDAITLTGPNGVGKTTLLRVLAGLLRPSAGTVNFSHGANDDRPQHAHIHFVGPQNALKAALTVEENLTFWQCYLGDPSRQSAAQSTARTLALDSLGLQDLADIPAGFLSTGQRRRAGLARLVAVDRPVWLLDEPTLGLDTASRKTLGKLISSHTGNGGIAIVATHADLGLERAAHSVRELRLGIELEPEFAA